MKNDKNYLSETTNFPEECMDQIHTVAELHSSVEVIDYLSTKIVDMVKYALDGSEFNKINEHWDMLVDTHR